MRILHVTPTYIPAHRYGGPITSVHNLCKCIVNNRISVDVVTTNVDGDDVSDVPTGIPVRIDNVNVRYFNTGKGLLRRLYYSSEMSRYMKKRIKRYSIVHNHSVFLWPTKKSAQIARNNLINYIITPRGMLIKELFKRKNRIIKQLWFNYIEMKNIKGASAIHFTSETEAVEFSKFDVHAARSIIIGNGVKEYEDDDSTIGDDVISATKEPGYFLFIGRISWKKGIDRTISLLKNNRKMRLIIAGNDEEELVPELLLLARGYQVYDQIVWLPRRVNDEEKKWLFKHALCLLLLSYSENFGNIVMESLYYQCPVIVTEEVGCSDIVKTSGGGFVVKSEKELRRFVLITQDNDTETKRMGQKGSEYVQKHYRWEDIAARMKKEYRTIISQ